MPAAPNDSKPQPSTWLASLPSSFHVCLAYVIQLRNLSVLAPFPKMHPKSWLRTAAGFQHPGSPCDMNASQ